MNKVIHKYVFNHERFPTFYIPKGSCILSAKNQDDDICVWVLCNRDEKELIETEFVAAYTGEPEQYSTIDNNNLIFIDTIVMNNGKTAIHVFMKYLNEIQKLR